MAFAVSPTARLPLGPPQRTGLHDDAYSGFTHVADRAIASAPLRTRPLDHARGHRYQGPRRLPGPDSHRQAIVNLSLLRHVVLLFLMAPKQSRRTADDAAVRFRESGALNELVECAFAQAWQDLSGEGAEQVWGGGGLGSLGLLLECLGLAVGAAAAAVGGRPVRLVFQQLAAVGAGVWWEEGGRGGGLEAGAGSPFAPGERCSQRDAVPVSPAMCSSSEPPGQVGSPGRPERPSIWSRSPSASPLGWITV